MTPLRLVPQPVDPWTPTERAILGAEVGRMLRFSLATLDPKGAKTLTNEARLAACLTVMADHTERLDRRKPGWLAVAEESGWL